MLAFYAQGQPGVQWQWPGFWIRTTTRTTEAQPGWTPRSEKNVMLLTRIAKHTGPVKRKLSSAMIVSYRISTTAHSAFRTSEHRCGFRPKSICRHHPHHSTFHIAHGQSKYSSAIRCQCTFRSSLRARHRSPKDLCNTCLPAVALPLTPPAPQTGCIHPAPVTPRR